MPPDNSAAPSPREPELPALDWLRRAGGEAELLHDVAGKLRRKRRRRLAVATACVLALSCAALAPHFLRKAPAADRLAQVSAAAPTTPGSAVASATTSISRPERRTLPDGSVVELNLGAEIALDFSAAVRRVALLRGEAHFAVAKNPQRPFVVQAGQVEVRAVGTAFAVQLAARDVDVLVTEGRVKVTSAVPLSLATAPAAETPHALVDAGDRCLVVAGAAPRIVPASPAQAGAQLAWRVPQFEFSRAPLHEVLALMNEHALATGAPAYVVADPALGAIKLTGVLRADNTEGLERLLEISFDLRLERTGAKVLLHRRY